MCPLHKFRQWFRNREDIATTRCKKWESTKQLKVTRSFFLSFRLYKLKHTSIQYYCFQEQIREIFTYGHKCIFTYSMSRFNNPFL
jgi:hypothetical protein